MWTGVKPAAHIFLSSQPTCAKEYLQLPPIRTCVVTNHFELIEQMSALADERGKAIKQIPYFLFYSNGLVQKIQRSWAWNKEWLTHLELFLEQWRQDWYCSYANLYCMTMTFDEVSLLLFFFQTVLTSITLKIKYSDLKASLSLWLILSVPDKMWLIYIWIVEGTHPHMRLLSFTAIEIWRIKALHLF